MLDCGLLVHADGFQEVDSLARDSVERRRRIVEILCTGDGNFLDDVALYELPEVLLTLLGVAVGQFLDGEDAVGLYEDLVEDVEASLVEDEAPSLEFVLEVTGSVAEIRDRYVDWSSPSAIKRFGGYYSDVVETILAWPTP